MPLNQVDLNTAVNPAWGNSVVDLLNSNEVVVLRVEDLTAAEIAQLENIGTTTISATQWGYVGGADQALKTTDSPRFAVLSVNNSGIHILDTDASHDLILAVGSNLSADKTLTLTTGDSDRTITLSGNPTLADWFDQAVKQASNVAFANLTLSGARISTVDTFTDGDATPSVSGGENFLTANTGATEITDFDDAVNGQVIVVMAGDGNTTIATSSQTNIKCGAGSGLVMAEFDTATFVYNGSVWVCTGYQQNSA